jgi:hypothetical protein
MVVGAMCQRLELSVLGDESRNDDQGISSTPGCWGRQAWLYSFHGWEQVGSVEPLVSALEPLLGTVEVQRVPV